MAGNRISVRALDSDGLGLKTMAESGKTDNFGETLKPFYLRASAAEMFQIIAVNKLRRMAVSSLERLSKLEAVLVTKKGGQDEELLKTISELQSKLKDANTEAEKLTAENEKLKYRVKHLIRAVKEADLKLESM
ncbi:Threonine-tRNA ligase [Melia azedarach]|uniref:Threonine-tRNA ligase n=1 Tax=Melia azedarach TaxID=155640 RepID=A0ACC1X4E2_MELAZ|nr:Threonine-tRNA ligase [Melia azedarach]